MGAGGPIVVDSEDEGLQVSSEVGNIHEMAARLRELHEMRAEDPQNEGLKSGSPTEVMDVDSNSEPEIQVSPWEALRQLVAGMKQEKKKESTPAENQLESDAHGMGLTEVQKLKFKVPKELKMPWETGFAGLVLGRKQDVETGFLNESTRQPHAIQAVPEVKVEDEAMDVGTKVNPSFKIETKSRMPWS